MFQVSISRLAGGWQVRVAEEFVVLRELVISCATKCLYGCG